MQKKNSGIAKCYDELSANKLGLKGKWEEMKNVNTPDVWEYINTWSEKIE